MLGFFSLITVKVFLYFYFRHLKIINLSLNLNMRAQPKPNRSGDLQKAGESDDQYRERLKEMAQELTVV